jgi:hypothetical protein
VSCAAAVLAAGPARADAPFGFIGMNAEDVYAGSDAYQEQMLFTMQAYGVTVLRQNFRWGYTEIARGVFDWTQLDRFVLAAARHGIRVLPLLYGETPWATSRPPGNEDRCAYPPKKNSDFGNWVGQVAARYGRTGQLWREHPDLSHQAITAYEIWNEPNKSNFWKCKPDAKAYVALARAASNAIRVVDPKAYIISAGSPVINKSPGKYLKAMFKHGAKDVFNAVALHPYEPDSTELLNLVKDARKVIDDQGAKSWKLVITEFGWATAGPKAEGKTVNESKQATLVENSFTKMGKERKKLKIASAIYYAWHDLPPAVGQDDYWGLHTGILRPNDTAKPSLDAVVRASREIK